MRCTPSWARSSRACRQRWRPTTPQYFSNRAAIVAARQRTLGDRENEIRKLRGLLAELDARVKALGDVQEQRRKAVDLRRYNDDVEEFNELIVRYNTAAEALNARIAEYNDLLSG